MTIRYIPDSHEWIIEAGRLEYQGRKREAALRDGSQFNITPYWLLLINKKDKKMALCVPLY